MDIRECIALGFSEDALPSKVGPFSIYAVLRWLPGRRLVADASWNGRKVIVKFFSADVRGQRGFIREKNAIGKLHEYGVAAPRVLASSCDATGCYLVLEKLVGETAQQVYQVASSESREQLVRGLVEWIRCVQDKGVLQRDIHLGNFFLAEGGWHMLDAAACQFGRKSRSKRRRNLAALVAQFYPLDVPPLDIYFSGLGEYSRVLDQERKSRYVKILKKTQRNCSEFAEVSKGRLRGVCRREFLAEMDVLLSEDRDTVMQESALLKDGNSATVVVVPERNWVIKRYNIKSRLHWFKRQWGRTRARNAWLAGYFLRTIGVRTPLPVAFFEEKDGPFMGRAWIVNELVDGIGLDKIPASVALDSRLLRDLSDLFSLMERLNFSHGDMKASNFIVDEGGISVIDLDAFRFFESGRASQKHQHKDKLRLLRNWSESEPVRESIESVVAV